MLKHYAYRASFLSTWNSVHTRDELGQRGLYDKKAAMALLNDGFHFEETDRYRSVYSYSKLVDALNTYDKEPNQMRLNLSSGLAISRRKFENPKPYKLTPLRLDDPELMRKADIRGDKSAGLTQFGRSKFEAWGEGLRLARLILTRGKAPHPAIAYTRTQKNEKTRLVWGYPLEMTILESLIARPIIDEFLSRTDHPMAFGRTSTQMAGKFNAWSHSSDHIVGADFSQFDASVKQKHIHFAFDVLKSYFDLEDVVFRDITVGDVFNIVESYFTTTPLVFPSHKGPTLVLGKQEGVPSGSYFTQIVDSIVNYALSVDAFNALGVAFDYDQILVLGDDMIAFTRSRVNLEAYASQMAQYGYKCNASKSGQWLSTETFEFLGRRWKQFKPVRNQQEVADRALYPEKFRMYDDVNGFVEAVSLVRSYGLTAYIEGTDFSRTSILVQPGKVGGYFDFLRKEGMIVSGTQRSVIW